MRRDVASIRREWRAKLRLFPIYPLTVALFVGGATLNDFSEDRSFDWWNLITLACVLAVSAAIYVIAWGLLREAEQLDRQS